jgi:hypothetical protein
MLCRWYKEVENHKRAEKGVKRKIGGELGQKGTIRRGRKQSKGEQQRRWSGGRSGGGGTKHGSHNMEKQIGMDRAGVFVFGCCVRGHQEFKPEAAIRRPQLNAPKMSPCDSFIINHVAPQYAQQTALFWKV